MEKSERICLGTVVGVHGIKGDSQSPTERNTVPTAPPEFTGGKKQKVNGKGGLMWTVRQEKSLDL